MGIIRTSKKAFLTVISVFFSVILGVSCSQTVPDIVTADYSVVFEYKDEESLPSSRLALFLESESDVRRYASVRLFSRESGLVWETDDLLSFQNAELEWAGNANFVPPEKEIIPSGIYEVTFVNADEQEDTLEFTVRYDHAFTETLSADVPDLMEKQGGVRKIAVYDEGGKMLYFGNRTSELRTVRGIWNAYREAKIFQDIWCSADGTVMCILPEENVALE